MSTRFQKNKQNKIAAAKKPEKLIVENRNELSNHSLNSSVKIDNGKSVEQFPKELQMKLDATNLELNNVNIENIALKDKLVQLEQVNEEQQSKIKILNIDCIKKDSEIKELKRRISSMNLNMMEISLLENGVQGSEDRLEVLDSGSCEIEEKIKALNENMEKLETSLIIEINTLKQRIENVELNHDTSDTPIIKTCQENIAKENNIEEFKNCRVRCPSLTSCQPKGRILIIGDSQSRQATVLLKDYVRNNYEIETIIKPGATFEAVIDNIKLLTKSFNQNDFVIVIAGTNNILKRLMLNGDAVFGLHTDLNHTNCLIVSVPYFKFNVRRNVIRDVQLFNSVLYECVCSVNCKNFKFVDINSDVLLSDVARNNVHLTKAEKRRLFYYIAKYHLFSSDSVYVISRACNCNGTNLVSYHGDHENLSEYDCNTQDDTSLTNANFSNVIATNLQT